MRSMGHVRGPSRTTVAVLLLAVAVLLGPGCSAFRAEVGLGVGIGAEVELPVVLHTGFSASGFYYLGHNYRTGWRAGNPGGHFDESMSVLFIHGTDDYGKGYMDMHECLAFLPIWSSREDDPTEWQALEVRVFALFIAFRLGMNPWNWFAKEEPPPAPAKTPAAGTATAATVPEPPKEDPHFTKGTLSLQEGEFQASIEELTAAVSESPTAPAWYNLGLAHANMGQHLRAVECYDEALKLDPKLDLAYGARAGSYLMSKSFAEAIADYDRAIAREPKAFRFFLLRGMARAALPSPDLELVIADFSRALDLEPNQPDALVGRLGAYIQKKDTKLAEAEFLKVQSLGIPLPDPIRLWGVAMGLTPPEKAGTTEKTANPDEDDPFLDAIRDWESLDAEPPEGESPEAGPSRGTP